MDAGVVWRDLLLTTVPAGLTPPVLTDYTRLTVAGTLSVGGISGRSYMHGAQVDNVLELQVVTGEGELVTCSESENRDLFEAVLAGLGLCAVIVRATIRLIPAGERARTLRLFYPDAPAMLADLRFLTGAERFDHIRGMSVATPAGFAFFIEATSFYTSAAELPENPTAGLNFIPGSQQVEDMTYFEYTDLVVKLIDQLNEAGSRRLPAPLAGHVRPRLADRRLRVADHRVARPFALPAGLADTLLPVRQIAAHPPAVPRARRRDVLPLRHPAHHPARGVDSVLAENRRLYEQSRDLGGKLYTISAVEMGPHDWQEHFRPFWGLLVSEKSKHDPDNVLGPGPGVFV